MYYFFATIFKHIFPVEFDFWKMFSNMITVATEPNFLGSTRLFSWEWHFEHTNQMNHAEKRVIFKSL